MALNDQVLARIPTYPDQELHLRLREAPEMPPVLDIALFNTEGGGYRLACLFPDDPDVVDGLIAALQARQASR
ncbi:hypothetical protein [Streptomyces sp900116325]|uniref:hypothetical protein n=1 Tax=Streptomyces sp. 900116325 TaxID=3154295 RepID=UPI0033BD56F0